MCIRDRSITKHARTSSKDHYCSKCLVVFPVIPDTISNEEISEKMKAIDLELVERLETELNEEQVR